MAVEVLSNNVVTTLNGGINASVTTITVASAASMPQTGQFRIVVETALGVGTGEIMLVVGVASNVLTVVRNYETNPGASSNPQSFLTGASVSLQLTAGAILAYVQQYLTAGIGPLAMVAKSASFTPGASTFNLVTTSTNTIVATLPAPTLSGQQIGFAKVDTAAGLLNITSATNGGDILGPGCGTATTQIPCSGLHGAFVILESDGTNWHIIAGALDTGWVPFPTYTNSWASAGGPATGNTVAGYRQIANQVQLGGSIQSGTSATAAITMPATAGQPSTRPTRAMTIPTCDTVTPTLCTLGIATTGVITPTFSAGTVPTLDNVEWEVD